MLAITTNNTPASTLHERFTTIPRLAGAEIPQPIEESAMVGLDLILWVHVSIITNNHKSQLPLFPT
jgi:hypothetical protein